jgi:hypothetical protein
LCFFVFSASHVSVKRSIVAWLHGPGQWIVTTAVGFLPFSGLMNCAPFGARITTSDSQSLPDPLVQISSTFRCMPRRVLSVPEHRELVQVRLHRGRICTAVVVAAE